jgi:hypothetical protein
MMNMRMLILVAIVAFVLGRSAGDSEPRPSPAHDRPVLRLLVRVAKLGLWALAFAEPAPHEHQHVQHSPDSVDHFRSL